MPLIKAVGSSLLAVGSFGLATAINYSLSGLVDCWIAGEFIAGKEVRTPYLSQCFECCPATSVLIV